MMFFGGWPSSAGSALSFGVSGAAAYNDLQSDMKNAQTWQDTTLKDYYNSLPSAPIDPPARHDR